jgi:ribosomal-protein-alanine acetyltransferase
VGSAALDAHRREVFLRITEQDGSARELLAGAEELAALRSGRGIATIAVCEESTESLLRQAWPGVNLVRTEPPTAADAIEQCIPRVLARDFDDLALLDGHYLRRSDAEIFGDSAQKAMAKGTSIRVRKMRREDLDHIMSIAVATHHAPGWPRQAYETALNPDAQPRRVVLVAEEGQLNALAGFVVASLTPPEAELETIVTALAHQGRGVARALFLSLKGELRRLGARDVTLEVRAGNAPAQGFYRFLGFAEEGRRTGYYRDPVEDAILMRLPIV